MARGSRIDFCCCAIPLVNAGAYMIVLEFLLVSTSIVALALFPPPIVATMGCLPGWSKLAVATLSLHSTLLQILGLVSIAKESALIYRIYVRLNFGLTLLIIAATASSTLVSYRRREDSIQVCNLEFGNTPDGNGKGFKIDAVTQALKGSGKVICNYFTLVQVGAMASLIFILGVTQLYLCLCQRAYGKQQRQALDRRVTW
ncbi:hypothetical protein IE53DRAFT_312971 [Violaceomyces palustris]|uniref:Uncharacterized protein n=1 Tax=Violaceomyces palustris TaxID=1673888 RepID=A0ACD0P1M8_9BASI|nr:hypothetical protein IE53DRAFT_312971 [Violaceomyces palustris]